MSDAAKWLRARAALGLLAALAAGCQQKMAQQPLFRPYEAAGEIFANGQSNRPIESGTAHRNQRFESDPLVTGLTADEWERARKLQAAPPAQAVPTETENRERNIGAPRFDPRDASLPKVYVTEFPFPIAEYDLYQGQQRYTTYCAPCHGAYGNGQGKIWERGYLKPTSFHTQKVEGNEASKDDQGVPMGYSRGYWRFGIEIPMRDVPVGYIFEVATHGFGGMPDYAAQVTPADRWRIVAYIRTLQLSQNADAGKLPETVRATIGAAGAAAPAGGKH